MHALEPEHDAPTVLWASPSRSYTARFVKITSETPRLRGAGLLILTNETHTEAQAVVIQELRRELLELVQHEPDDRVAYWRSCEELREAEELLQKLSERPVFVGWH